MRESYFHRYYIEKINFNNNTLHWVNTTCDRKRDTLLALISIFVSYGAMVLSICIYVDDLFTSIQLGVIRKELTWRMYNILLQVFPGAVLLRIHHDDHVVHGLGHRVFALQVHPRWEVHQFLLKNGLSVLLTYLLKAKTHKTLQPPVSLQTRKTVWMLLQHMLVRSR